MCRAVKGLGICPTSHQHWKSLLGLPSRPCPQCPALPCPEVDLALLEWSSSWKQLPYPEQEVDALELSLGLKVLPWETTYCMKPLPFHRTEGHTSEDSAGSSDWSSSQYAKRPASSATLQKKHFSICLTIMGASSYAASDFICNVSLMFHPEGKSTFFLTQRGHLIPHCWDIKQCPLLKVRVVEKLNLRHIWTCGVKQGQENHSTHTNRTNSLFTLNISFILN